MRRHLPRLLLTGALLSPVTLYALGLGEIRLTSALNQPFDARIELISPTADELDTLTVGLASPDLFSRYGLDRPAFLSGLQFSVERSRDGRASIKVTSSRSIREPFVTLLVEASWTRGRLLREYTVLLDPPVFMPAQPAAQAPVAAPQSGAQTEGRIERRPAPPPQPEPETPVAQAEEAPAAPVQEAAAPEAPAAEPAATASAATIGGTYTVERNDTLWRIASRANPGSLREINQTMIALFRANPEAFDGNINRLRAGSVLRIPELSEIEAISGSEATAEVVRQAAEWSGAAPSESVAERDRLRLVTPEETPSAPAPAAQQTSPAAQTSSAGSPSGTAAADDKRLELGNPDLASVQQNVDETPAAPQPEAAPASEQTPAEAQEQPPAQTPPAAAEPAPEPASRPAPPAVQEPQGPTLLERIGEFWWVLVVAGLLIVVALVLALVRRRREASAAAALDSLAPLSFDSHAERAAPAATVTRTRERPEPVPEPEPEDVFEGFDDEPEPVTARRPEAPAPAPVEVAAPAVVAAPKPSDDTLSSETAVRFDQQDALAEADFHMAYGLYDQAADLVRIAIDREPQRRDLKLKLLEIYFVWGNKDLFLETARDLHASRAEAAAGEWDKVLIMGRQIAADDPMFEGSTGATHVDLVDVNLEGGENRVDVDLFAEPEADKPAGLDLEFASGEHEALASDAQSPTGELDFLLDEPSRGSDEEPTRELDPQIDSAARTQETPTIESPAIDSSEIDRSSATIREKPGAALAAKAGTEQTAELSLDDLGLDVDSLEHTGSLEDTTSLEKDTDAEPEPQADAAPRPLGDDEMTQLAPSLGSFDRTMEAPQVEKFDIESTGTIYIDQVDLSGGDTVEQQRPDMDSTAAMQRPRQLQQEVDLDLDSLSGLPQSEDTIRQASGADVEADRFSSDVFAERTSEVPRIDLDVGEPLSIDDHEPTNKQLAAELELSELEPVTMSEVGTKLDLARAYMDMGDPDGARSILEEVLAEGNPSQKQEAQRLVDSIR